MESTFCPGYQHGTIGRILCEVIDELEIQGKTISIAGVGCHAMTLFTMNVDVVQALHGRAPSVGTGVKRAVGKERVVFTVQGDGDLASIGIGDVVHAANRGESLPLSFATTRRTGLRVVRWRRPHC